MFKIQHGPEFIIKRYNNKSYKQNSPNLGFRSFALALASFPLTANAFLLLSLKIALSFDSKLTQNPPIRALYCTHTDNLTKPFLLLLIGFLLSF